MSLQICNLAVKKIAVLMEKRTLSLINHAGDFNAGHLAAEIIFIASNACEERNKVDGFIAVSLVFFIGHHL